MLQQPAIDPNQDGELVQFAEPLPPQCPPLEAHEGELRQVFRLLESPHPTEDAFKSHAARGKACPKGVDPCRWASCSLTLDTEKLRKLPKFKDTHQFAAVLNIPEKSGLAKGGGPHIDFWRGKHFDIVAAVTRVVRLP